MIYLLNKNTSEIHRLDDDRRSKESCNVDDISDAEEIEEAEALRLVAADPDLRCGHCWIA